MTKKPNNDVPYKKIKFLRKKFVGMTTRFSLSSIKKQAHKLSERQKIYEAKDADTAATKNSNK